MRRTSWTYQRQNFGNRIGLGTRTALVRKRQIQRAVDTVVVAGCTTSGCVRATVVDAMIIAALSAVAEPAR